MQKLSQRLKEIRTHFGLKQSELAQIMGAGEATVKAIEQDRTFNVKPKYAIALEDKLKINRGWIEHGEGDMLITEHGKLLTQIALLDRALNNDSIVLPFYEDIQDTEYFTSISMPMGVINNPSRRLIGVKINDDSMKGTIDRDSIIFINMDDSTISSGKIYKMSINGEAMIRRIYKTSSSDELLIKSDNPIYPEYLISEKEFCIFGRVVATMNITLL